MPSYDGGMTKNLAARPRSFAIRHLKVFSTGSPGVHPQSLWKTRQHTLHPGAQPRTSIVSSHRRYTTMPSVSRAHSTFAASRPLTKIFAARARVNTIKHLSGFSTGSRAEHPQHLWKNSMTTHRHGLGTGMISCTVQAFVAIRGVVPPGQNFRSAYVLQRHQTLEWLFHRLTCGTSTAPVENSAIAHRHCDL
jgi:hypothetical protein